jgi:hypothetical protein
MPEGVVPGEAMKFTTTLPLSGFGRGVIVTSIDGRPIKVEGHPLHPASLGATDVFSEAAVLSLYDPDRSRTVLNKGAIACYDAFRLALQPIVQQMQKRSGEGFRLLTGRVTSPTLLRQIGDLLEMFFESVLAHPRTHRLRRRPERRCSRIWQAAGKKLIDGVHAEVGSRTIKELEAERDEILLGLLELRAKRPEMVSPHEVAPSSECFNGSQDRNDLFGASPF